MALWRIRITLADDPHSRTVLDQALAGQRISALNFTPRTARPSEVAGDVASAQRYRSHPLSYPEPAEA